MRGICFSFDLWILSSRSVVILRISRDEASNDYRWFSLYLFQVPFGSILCVIIRYLLWLLASKLEFRCYTFIDLLAIISLFLLCVAVVWSFDVTRVERKCRITGYWRLWTFDVNLTELRFETVLVSEGWSIIYLFSY
jgi:hypothetical protein